jgi:hypothetical protein
LSLTNSYLLSLLGNNFQLVTENKVSAVYEIDSNSEIMAQLVGDLENRKEELGVIEWSLGQPTLDDVFVKLCGEAEEEV